LGGSDRWIQALVLSPFVGQKLRPFSTKPNQADLQFLRELVDAGEVRPVLDRSYALSEVPDAIRYLSEGHARGKVVITVRGTDRR
jgi:NADPH:quinone reductase-like Zn-dependent oxidoreductase